MTFFKKSPSLSCIIILTYSVLSATTGSFFAAERAGMIPAMSVSAILMIMSNTPPAQGSVARILLRPVTA